jgi:hypothetical protein
MLDGKHTRRRFIPFVVLTRAWPQRCVPIVMFSSRGLRIPSHPARFRNPLRHNVEATFICLPATRARECFALWLCDGGGRSLTAPKTAGRQTRDVLHVASKRERAVQYKRRRRVAWVHGLTLSRLNVGNDSLDDDDFGDKHQPAFWHSHSGQGRVRQLDRGTPRPAQRGRTRGRAIWLDRWLQILGIVVENALANGDLCHARAVLRDFHDATLSGGTAGTTALRPL